MGYVFNENNQIERRRQLRNNATNAERKLWSKLKGRQLLGYKFRRQHGIGKYIVDFYCTEAKLVIEIDGETHCSDAEIEYDKNRQREIETLGIEFIRVTNHDVFYNIDGVLVMIGERVSQRNATTPSSPP